MPYVCCTFRAKPVLSKQLLISAWALLLIIPFLCTSQILFKILSHNLWKVEVYDCCFTGRVLRQRAKDHTCAIFVTALNAVGAAGCRGSSWGSEGAAVFAQCPAAREGPVQVFAKRPVEPQPSSIMARADRSRQV